jgi:PHS family inorganic phosphate transporter-like MFS transporter
VSFCPFPGTFSPSQPAPSGWARATVDDRSPDHSTPPTSKAILISGVGLFSDAYDMFSIGLAKPAIGIVYFSENNGILPLSIDLAITGVSFIGAFLGHLVFGYLGDKKGRKSMYLLTLIVMITATIGQASAGSAVRGFSFAVWLVIWRFMLGCGIGGDFSVRSRGKKKS